MITERSSARSHRAQLGFGLIEIMVGVVIGLIAVLVIFQVYSVAEGFKRNTTAAGEAQMNGLFSTFVLGLELGNGGAAMAFAAKELALCRNTGNIGTTFRPIPVLITDGGGNANPDSFVVNYSMATKLASAVMFNADAAVGQTSYQVQSPGGFLVGDLIVGINPNLFPPDCASSKVTQVDPPGDIVVNINGDPTTVANEKITHTGAAIPFTGDGRPGLSTLFNMGPADRAQKIQYSVNNGVLYSTPLLDSNGAPAALPGNPLASNIVNMKVEYGIDSNLDPKRLLDYWVQGTTGTPKGDWDPATLLAAPITTINQIKAVRIGIIVQSEQFDKNLAGFTGGDYVNGASVSPPGNWRFRKYETVIPLRNEIWNKQ